ncbi:MAG TPA: DUF4301 family protein [Candidatus Krumholzibacteria bacterium]|nr:DUF4301 family protein [Candidatus Krumholzibacteria bacterium]
MQGEWTPRDLDLLRQHAIPVEEAERQLRLFARPPHFLQLDRPCTLGDGIRHLDQTERAACLEAYEAARLAGRFLKFVPASGAASRMFAPLLEALHGRSSLRRDDLAARHDDAADEVLCFADSLPLFAFHDQLRRSLAASGLDLGTLLAGDLRPALEHLLTAKGLAYGDVPKGLLPFHRYSGTPRTAFEEHLVEAAHAIADREGCCRLHFTVAPEWLPRFEALLASRRPDLETRFGVRFDIGFSSQKAATATLAVDLEGHAFRNDAGDLLLRPGGHGALLENLGALGADLVMIKNIDNVTTEDQLADTLLWKKVLGGYLCSLQQRLFAHVSRLQSGGAPERAVEEALHFVRDDLGLTVPPAVTAAGTTAQRDFLLQRLDSPVRVCGMVHNRGEPGGGPFWVRGADEESTVQIVERAQIDTSNPEQQRIFASMTHFSPVDLVCGLRDARGQAFALQRYVDHEAVFISEKSSAGRKLRALEHPGLWNGGMSRWITLLVEVPETTFNPVKTINDLLRPAHQPQ